MEFARHTFIVLVRSMFADRGSWFDELAPLGRYPG